MLKVNIIDGYIDEPTCLGVPPYISPYPRYIAGAIWKFDKKTNIKYFTIDQIRKNISLLNEFKKSDIIIIIAGISVPGRYLSGYPASQREIISLTKDLTKPIKILCGPAARYGFGFSGGKKPKEANHLYEKFDYIIKGDSETVIFNLLKNYNKKNEINLSECRENSKKISIFSILGSKIVQQHPLFPDYLIIEIETYRGCPRGIVGGCSFCSEPSKGKPDFRDIKDIVNEISELYNMGIRHFRLGNQPCIFSYKAKNAKNEEFPQPNPVAIENLFKGIRNVAPFLRTLHIDNANPGTIARYPIECKRIAKIIVKYHTPGDVAALGVESLDPNVKKKNNLKANADEVYLSIKLLNEIGIKKGINGMPELLPGLNFISGLDGENKNTYEINYNFLKKILDDKLLVRRINLRQIIPLPGTKLYEKGLYILKKNKKEFYKFKRKVLLNIEQPMLIRMLPTGSVMKNVLTEKHIGKVTFGRQMGSYPLLVGIPGIYSINKFIEVKVVSYGYRSITAVPYPININNTSKETLESIPGIGKKRALRIISNRPYKNYEEFNDIFDDPNLGNSIKDYFSYE